MHKGRYLQDFYRQEHWIDSQEGLYELYQLWEEQRIERLTEKLGLINPNGGVPGMEPDEFTDWLIKRGFCPHAIITKNSQYHFENSVLLDGEMGLTLPYGLNDTPELFFQGLKIVRSARAKVKEEDNAQNNRNKDSG